MSLVSLTILGEPASKANSRKLVQIAGRPSVIKSEKARAYVKSALLQIPVSCRRRIEGPVAVTMRIFYATERPDLDESVILDVLQDQFAKNKKTGERVLVQAGVYRNDRQVREKHIHWGLDKKNPRAEIDIHPLGTQGNLLEAA